MSPVNVQRVLVTVKVALLLLAHVESGQAFSIENWLHYLSNQNRVQHTCLKETLYEFWKTNGTRSDTHVKTFFTSRRRHNVFNWTASVKAVTELRKAILQKNVAFVYLDIADSHRNRVIPGGYMWVDDERGKVLLSFHYWFEWYSLSTLNYGVREVKWNIRKPFSSYSGMNIYWHLFQVTQCYLENTTSKSWMCYRNESFHTICCQVGQFENCHVVGMESSGRKYAISFAICLFLLSPLALFYVRPTSNENGPYISLNKVTPLRITYPLQTFYNLCKKCCFCNFSKNVTRWIILVLFSIYFVYWIIIRGSTCDDLMLILNIPILTWDERFFRCNVFFGEYVSLIVVFSLLFFILSCMFRFKHRQSEALMNPKTNTTRDTHSTDSLFFSQWENPADESQESPLIEEVLLRRFSLIINLKYWKLWWKRLKAIKSEKNWLTKIFAVFQCMTCFVFLLPILGFILRWFKYHSSITKLPTCCNFVLDLFTFSFGLFSIYYVFWLCALFCTVVDYTIKGLLKHHALFLPDLLLAICVIHLIATVRTNLVDRYLFYKKSIFEAAQVASERYPRVYRRSGTLPQTPKDMYDEIIHELYPVEQYEMNAVLKVVFICLLFFCVRLNISVLDTEWTGESAAVGSFITFTIPSILGYFKVGDPLTKCRVNDEVEKAVMSYCRKTYPEIEPHETET